ncbi:hypothetical protein LZ32DRAFT_302974 [Colletotrichum eremochloae]|nr:hypothetical protein LZ32DRAFT_302974 [Colletotrichum eremochloae]
MGHEESLNIVKSTRLCKMVLGVGFGKKRRASSASVVYLCRSFMSIVSLSLLSASTQLLSQPPLTAHPTLQPSINKPPTVQSPQAVPDTASPIINVTKTCRRT